MGRDVEHDTDQLLRQVRQGNERAKDALLARHRSRLRKMVSLRLDRRLAARVDPSDIVQETLRVANRRLDEYLAAPKLRFYPWLRGIALERLIDMHRQHVRRQKRSVLREQPWRPQLNEESEDELANSLASSTLNPSRRLLLAEVLARVRRGLELLSPNDREILELRYLEQLSVEEIADVLAISKTAVTTRHLRAVQRLRQVMGENVD